MDEGEGITDAEWIATVRGLDLFASWHLLESNGRRLLETDAALADEILVRYWGTNRALLPSIQTPDFLSSLRQSVLRPDA